MFKSNGDAPRKRQFKVEDDDGFDGTPEVQKRAPTVSDDWDNDEQVPEPAAAKEPRATFVNRHGWVTHIGLSFELDSCLCLTFACFRGQSDVHH
jgi:hypothetical protein